MKTHIVYSSAIVIILCCLGYSIFLSTSYKSLAWKSVEQSETLYKMTQWLLSELKSKQ